MIGGIDIVGVIIYLIIIGGVCGLLWWLIGFCAAKGVLPAPFVGFAQVVVAVVAVLMLINLLLSFVGHGVVPIHFNNGR